MKDLSEIIAEQVALGREVTFWPAEFVRGDGQYEIGLRVKDAKAVGGRGRRCAERVISRTCRQDACWDVLMQSLEEIDGEFLRLLESAKP